MWGWAWPSPSDEVQDPLGWGWSWYDCFLGLTPAHPSAEGKFSALLNISDYVAAFLRTQTHSQHHAGTGFFLPLLYTMTCYSVFFYLQILPFYLLPLSQEFQFYSFYCLTFPFILKYFLPPFFILGDFLMLILKFYTLSNYWLFFLSYILIFLSVFLNVSLLVFLLVCFHDIHVADFSF